MESHRAKKEARRANLWCFTSAVSPEPAFFPVPHSEANPNTKSSHCEIWVYKLLEKNRTYSFVLPWTLILICRICTAMISQLKAQF